MSKLVHRRGLVAVICGAVLSLTLGWSTALGSHSAPEPDWVSVRIHGEGEVPTTGGPATITVDVRCPSDIEFEYSYGGTLEVTASQSNVVFGGVFNSAYGRAWTTPRCTGDWETIELEVLPDRGAFMMGRAEVEAWATFAGCCYEEYGYVSDADVDQETVTLRSSAVPVVVSPG